MSKQEEIIEVCGKKVVVRYVEGLSPCPPCVFYEEGCTCFEYCRKFDRGGETAYFVEAEPWIRCSDCALFLGGKCTRPGGECARKAPLSEETHSLREWAQILAANPDLRAEFDKMCPPQPIQGSIAPEADLDAEIKRYMETHIGRKGYWDRVEIARHFAEWGAEHLKR